MWGASALAPGDSSRMAVLIACVCLIGTNAVAHVDNAIAMLRIGSYVAIERKAHPPADYLTQAGAGLAIAGVLANPQSFVAQVRSRLHEETQD